jgi:HD-GYP domain-containing protein (c-di-GMP phosphodiesterase class II)
MSTLRARHEPTFEHATRVCLSAAAMATDLSFTAEDARQLALAALLHDVGKLALPQHIMVSSSPLSGTDSELVRAHPRIGYELLRRIPGLESAAEIVYASHERVDGRGYPRGLKGIEIPVGARVLAVADAADALLAGRPYRQAVSVAEAGAEIARCAGAQFDVDVVRAWFRAAERIPPSFASMDPELIALVAEAPCF